MPERPNHYVSVQLSAKLGNVLGRWTFLAFYEIELNLLTLAQRLEAGALD